MTAPTCDKCGALLSCVTLTCVRGVHCKPRRDPFAQADAENRQRAAREALERHQRAKAHRRDNQPPPDGGLFDEVRRTTQELFR